MIEVTDEMLNVARSMQSFELMIKRIIELHEANKPKPEPVAYRWWNQGCNCDECDQYFYSEDPDFISKNREPLYTTPPTREPLNETIIECIGYKYGFGTLEGSIEFTWYNSETIDFARGIEQAHGIT